ncbi:peptidase family M20/M25/M40 [Ilyonectria destructans]|nr:peptidase family M20/M25/M40 [Ilyonectria destructans]
MCDRVDHLEDRFIDRLRRAVEIPSISANGERRSDVFKASELIAAEMQSLGIDVKLKSLGKEPGTDLELPPLVLGRYGRGLAKPTVLVYCHYDVQPAAIEDGWKHDPFQLTIEQDGRLCGRGTSDDKGPLVAWLNMIEAFQKCGGEVPANLIFCFEGMEESGSAGLRAALEEEASEFFADVDVVCITDSIWAGNMQPSISRGLRGVLFYILAITGAKQDAHSGIFGGQISEPMTDMVKIMSTLVDSNGKLLIPGIYDNVVPVTDAERELYQNMKISNEDLDGGLGGRNLHQDVASNLISRYVARRMPALSIHRIESTTAGEGATTSIPAGLRGKFSIRTVPNMKAADVDNLVHEHIRGEFKRLESKNSLNLVCVHQSDWFYEDVNHWNYGAGVNAIETVWKTKPDFTCEGGSIPVALDFKEILRKSVLLLPVGRPTDGAHSINEKLDKLNYVNSAKVYGTYLDELCRMQRAVNRID